MKLNITWLCIYVGVRLWIYFEEGDKKKIILKRRERTLSKESVNRDMCVRMYVYESNI